MNVELGNRSLFPDLKSDVYLNYAAVSPIAAPVRAAMIAMIDAYAQLGLGALDTQMNARDAARRGFAKLAGTRHEDVALVQNTTSGVRAVAWQKPWVAGDGIVLFRGQFPANTTPWQLAAEHFGLNIHWLEADSFRTDREQALEALRTLVQTKRIALVAASLVQFDTGLRMPIEAISTIVHDAGAELFVDGIQGLGGVRFNMTEANVDYLACGGHKYLCAVEGAGFLAVKEDCAKRLVPRLAGWLSHEQSFEFLVSDTPKLTYDRPVRSEIQFMEGAAVSAIGYAGAVASLEMVNAVGPERTFKHVQTIIDLLEGELVERGFESLRAKDLSMRSCSLCMVAPGSLQAVSKKLNDAGIAVSTPNGKLRLAPHFSNNMDEIPRILAAL